MNIWLTYESQGFNARRMMREADGYTMDVLAAG